MNGVEKIFVDDTLNYDVIDDPESNYQHLLDYTEINDCLVITSLQVLSRDYRQLLEYFDELEALELDLIVLTSPELTLIEWKEVLHWVSRNDRLLHPRLLKLNLDNHEKNGTEEEYPLFKADKETKQLYWRIFWQIAGKNKIRQVSQKNGVPIEMAYRILQDFK